MEEDPLVVDSTYGVLEHEKDVSRSDTAAAFVRDAGDFFAADAPVFVARAPGRLDVMGGVADYSGSLVLQLPLALGALAAAQVVPDGRGEALAWSPPREPFRVPLVSLYAGLGDEGGGEVPEGVDSGRGAQEGPGIAARETAPTHPSSAGVPDPSPAAARPATSPTSLSPVTASPAASPTPPSSPLLLDPARLSAAKASLTSVEGARWPAYVLGVLPALLLSAGLRVPDSASVRVLVRSSVPEGAGVSSSAAVSVASAAALAGALFPSPEGGEGGAAWTAGADLGAGAGAGEGADGPSSPGPSAGDGAAGSSAPAGVVWSSKPPTAPPSPRPRPPMSAIALALAAQAAENGAAGAPCGVMDHVAASAGRAGELLRLRCDPATLLPAVAIPPGVAFWGLDTGMRHAVAGDAYGGARVAAFAGLGLLRARLAELGRGALVRLCELPEDLHHALERLPERVLGRDLPRPHPDPVAAPAPAHPHPVRAAATHAIRENLRVSRIANILRGGDETQDVRGEEETQGVQGGTGRGGAADAERGGDGAGPRTDGMSARHRHPVAPSLRPPTPPPVAALPDSALVEIADLMREAHEGYRAIGLGSDAADAIVMLVEAERRAAERAGTATPLFGAKITGGGSGGTVCVLGRPGAEGEAALSRVADAYARQRGASSTTIFSGSSDGAAAYGVYRVLHGVAERTRTIRPDR